MNFKNPSNLTLAILCFVFFYLLSPALIRAQTYTPVWTETYGNDSCNANLQPVQMLVDHSGFIYTLTNNYFQTYLQSASLVKMDQQGNVVWNKKYSGINNTGAIGIQIACDSSDNIFVAISGALINNGYTVLKYDSAGNLLWEVKKTTLGFRTDIPSAFVVSGAGSVYITGKAYTDPNFSDLYTFKLNPDGSLAWERYYNYPVFAQSNDRGEFIKMDSNENIYVSGFINAIRSVCKYDSSGNLQWTSNYGINFPITSLAIDDSSNVYLAGYSGSKNRIIKFDSSGVVKFDKLYTTSYSTKLNDAIVYNGSLYTTGNIKMSSFQNEMVLTMKFDLNGDTIWTRTFIDPITDNCSGNKILVDNTGNVTSFATVQGTQYLTNLIVLQYDSNGNLLWHNIPGNATPNVISFFGAATLDTSNQIFFCKVVDDSTIYKETVKLSSTGNQMWSQNETNYNNLSDIALKIIIDHQGNIITAGNSEKTYHKNDIAIVKYNANGSVIWRQRFALPSILDLDLSHLICDANDNILFCGTDRTYYLLDTTFVMKIDSSGNKIWSDLKFGNSSSMAKDNQDNVYILGFEPHITYSTAKILKYNSSGTFLWSKVICDSADCYDPFQKGKTLKFDGNNNLYAVATDEYDPLDPITLSNFVTLKLDTAGNVIWKRIYNGPDSRSDNVIGVILDNFLNPIVIGNSDDSTVRYSIVKYDIAGNFLWDAHSLAYPGLNDFPVSFVVDSYNNLYVTGYRADDFQHAKVLTMKFDSNGTIKWADTYSSNASGASVDHGISMTQDQSGRLIVVGSSTDSLSKILVIVYDSLGNRLYTDLNNQSNGIINHSQANDVVADQNASFYLAGTVANLDNGNEFLTMKYTDYLTSITNLNTDQNKLSSFPNPVKEKYALNYYSEKPCLATLETYDQTGKFISSRTISLNIGENLIPANANELHSGTYFHKLKLPDGKSVSCKINTVK
jgi:hypothetical protein